jgi:hypothetical protein
MMKVIVQQIVAVFFAVLVRAAKAWCPQEAQQLLHKPLSRYSQISLVRYRLFGRAYRNTNGIVISSVTCWVNKQEKEELNA